MTEQVTMTREEMRRWHVVEKVVEGMVSGRAAGEALGIGERQVWRLVVRVRKEGASGVVHRLRGRRSNRRIEERTEEAAKKRLGEETWHDFGATFAQEQLEEREGIRVSVPTVRKWQKEVGITGRGKRAKAHRSWRERRSCEGMLVQVDGSEHDWLEGRGPRCVLVTFIDDATGKRIDAEFVEHEDTRTLMRLTRKVIETYGRPVAIYVDKDSIYRVNRAATIEEELREEEPMTQYGRALHELGIGLICADSPQAKGRVERSFGVEQDRLVKELRLAGIRTMNEANEYLRKTYLPKMNQRFAVQPKRAAKMYRRLEGGIDLAAIFSIRTMRTVNRDWTVRFKGSWYQLAKGQPGRIVPGMRVEMVEHLDGSLTIEKDAHNLAWRRIKKRPKARNTHHALSAKELARTPRSPWKPPENHPWRRDDKRRWTSWRSCMYTKRANPSLAQNATHDSDRDRSHTLAGASASPGNRPTDNTGEL